MKPESKKYIRVRRIRRAGRTRSRMYGTAAIPRLSVFRSHQYLWAQVINDEAKKTLFSVTTRGLKIKGTKTDAASEIGKQIAELCKKAGVQSIVFDRGGARYHGRIKAFAEAARKGGLAF